MYSLVLTLRLILRSPFCSSAISFTVALYNMTAHWKCSIKEKSRYTIPTIFSKDPGTCLADL